VKQLKIGIVGLNFGTYIVDQLLAEPTRNYFQIAGVCDMDGAKAEMMSQRLGCKAYNDLDLLLADQEIRAVGLFTGPKGRAELLRRIIHAGKDVMTTKPFELDPEAAIDVLHEARRRKRIIHLNSPAPLIPTDLGVIVRWRDEFDLGRPVGARADAWASYREQANGSWYDDPKHCPVAPIFRIGIYLIYDIVHFFGEPQDVQVSHSRVFTGRPTPDNAQVGIRFKNGGLANIFSSFCIDDFQPYRNSLTLNFERGTVYRNVGPFPRIPGTEHTAKLSLVTHHNGKPLVERKKIEQDISGSYQWEVFHRALCGATFDRVTSPEEIVAGLKLVSAMGRAERSEKTEKV
jgi:predicted dehydrogenase